MPDAFRSCVSSFVSPPRLWRVVMWAACLMCVAMCAGCSLLLSFEACSSDGDCSAGQVCTSDNLCQDQDVCSSDEECGAGLVCNDAGTCEDAATQCSPETCPEGMVCGVDGVCVDEAPPEAIVLTVDLDPDAVVLASISQLRINVTPAGGASQEIMVPEGGASLTFPAEVSLNVAELGLVGQFRVEVVGEGCVAMEASGQVYACDNGAMPLVWGREDVDAGSAAAAQVTLGLASSCGDGVAAEGGEVEVCFLEQLPLALSDGEPDQGQLGNGIRILDFNGDGEPDLLAAWGGDFMSDPPTVSGVTFFLAIDREGSNGIVLADERQGGNLEVAAINLVGSSEGNNQPDIHKDIVVAVRNPPDGADHGGELKIWRGEGANAFRRAYVVELPDIPGEMQVENLIGGADSEPELVVSMRDNGMLLVIGHTEDSEQPEQLIEPLDIGIGGRGLVVVDMDGDGDLDLVTTAKGNTPDPLIDSRITVHINEDRQAFTSTIVAEEEPGTRDVVVLDLDGDGVLDLATVNENNGFLSVRMGQSPVLFDAPILVPLFNPDLLEAERPPVEPERLRSGDVDGDGITDLLACSREGTVVLALMAEGGGLKHPPVNLFVGEEPGQLGQDIQGCDVWRAENGAVDVIAVLERTTNTVRVVKRSP